MKKLIAISVMCALACGAAFADTSIGGAFFIGGKFVQGDNVENSHPQTGTLETDNYNTVLKANFGDSAAGGKVSLHNFKGGADLYDYVGWWSPIPQLRLQIGADTDGNFGTAQISGWGFTGETKNAGGIGAMTEYSGYGEGRNHSRSTGWYDGTGATSNFQARIYPIEGLSINLWIPFDKTENVAFTFARFELNVQYRLVDIGNINVSFQSRTGYIAPDIKNEKDKNGEYPDGKEYPDPEKWYGRGGVTDPSQSPKIFASFFLTAIENMAVDLGLAYRLPFTDKAYAYKEKGTAYQFVEAENRWMDAPIDIDKETEVTTYHPFEIGLGFRYNMGDFQFKLRSGISFAGSTEYADGSKDTVKDPFEISVNINPNYKLGNITVFFYAGLGVQVSDEFVENKGEGSSVVAWFVNPYVMISAGSLRFLTGFQVGSDGVKYPYYEGGSLKYDGARISWAIPFGFYTYF